MNYHREPLRNALAAEYVLGTLRGQARRRYQKLMMQSQLISETTAFWEQYLNGMGSRVPPITPPASVWEAIEVKLGFETTDDRQSAQVIKFQQRRTTIWRSVSGLASAAVVLLAVLLFFEQTVVAPPVTEIAIVNDKDANPLWLIEVAEGLISVRATDRLQASDMNDFELWMVPANGNPPISLGLLPEGGQLALRPPKEFSELEVSALAVSLEPPGGSPTGSPTEVLYVAPLNRV